MSFLGDALAHAILPGIGIAYIYGRDLFLGGLVAGIGTALGIGWLTRNRRLKEDTAIGIIFASMFALGIAIVTSTRTYSVDLTHILFGNILGVDLGDLYTLAGCGAVVLALVALFYKEFLVLSFDPTLLRVLKFPGEFLRLLLLVLLAVTIVASLRVVGTALMLAMLVTPAATAQLLVKRLHFMMGLAALFGMGSGVVGLYLSFHQSIASGPAMVLTATALFVFVFVLTQIRETWIRTHHPA
jgi:ABC-type Mn2+/Zn2+ transport system permease subunit